VTAQHSKLGQWVLAGLWHSLPSLWKVGRQQRITPLVSTVEETRCKAGAFTHTISF
jgi:hypothetical protein